MQSSTAAKKDKNESSKRSRVFFYACKKLKNVSCEYDRLNG